VVKFRRPWLKHPEQANAIKAIAQDGFFEMNMTFTAGELFAAFRPK